MTYIKAVVAISVFSSMTMATSAKDYCWNALASRLCPQERFSNKKLETQGQSLFMDLCERHLVGPCDEADFDILVESDKCRLEVCHLANTLRDFQRGNNDCHVIGLAALTKIREQCANRILSDYSEE